MPCLEITLPEVDDEIRAALAARLCEAFVAATGFPGDIFGVRFCQYGVGEASAGDGWLWSGGDERPYLHLLLYCPRVSREVKQGLVNRFTDAFVEGVGRPEWRPVIHICEHAYENVGVDGELLSDRYPELAERSFYYPMHDSTGG